MILLPIAMLAVGCGDPYPITAEPIGTSGSSSTGSGSSSSGAMPQGSESSGSRLKIIVYAGEDGSKYSSSGVFYDSVSGNRCAVSKAWDGAFRCMPFERNAIMGQYFGNNVCTNPLGIMVKDAACPIVPEFAVRVVASACSSVTSIRPVNGSNNGMVYTKNGSACVLVDPAALVGLDVYSLGPEADYNMFPKFGEGHE